MTVEISDFTRADIDDAFELWRRSEGIGLFGDTADVVAGCLERSRGLSFVARDAGVLIAAVLCTHDGRRGYLHHLAVSPDARGRSIASALLRRCFEQLAARGIPKCNIFLFGSNAAGRAFWEHTGWTARPDLEILQKLVRSG